MTTQTPVTPVLPSVYDRCAWPAAFPVALQKPGAVYDVHVHANMADRGLLDVFVTARDASQYIATMETGSRTWLMIHALAAGSMAGLDVDPSAYGHMLNAKAEEKAEANSAETVQILARGKRTGNLYAIRRPVRSPEFKAAVDSMIHDLARMPAPFTAIAQAEATVEAHLRMKPAPVRTCARERMDRGTAGLLALCAAGVSIVFMAAVFGLL